MSLRLRGTPGAPGIVIGPIWRWTDGDGAVRDVAVGLDDGAALAASQLSILGQRLRDLGRQDEADIFDAQAMMATDSMLLEAARALMATGATAPAAISEASDAFAATLAALDDDVLAARAADVRDVGARIARVLEGRSLSLPAVPSIVVADDLPPSVTAEVPAGLLLGIALRAGSPTAHAVILARSLGIPAVVGLAELGSVGVAWSNGTTAPPAVLDGAAGVLIVGPTDADLTAAEKRRAEAADAAVRATGLRGRAGATADGVAVRLLANAGRPEDVARAVDAAAEGIGLFRTEFLFLGRDRAPDEDEQLEAYAEAMRAFAARPVVIRLADIGGDKSIPFLHLPPEANPFLGVRAIRLAATHRELLVTQARAIWRAGAAADSVPHVMAPMVATLADLATFRGLIDEAAAALDAGGLARAPRLDVGIMVEVPAAVWWAPELAAAVDFFSIGTNDLTQYVLAADRTNPSLAAYHDGLEPAVLRAIAAVVGAADAAGVPVAVCGELASDPAGALVLVGLGVDELSMDPGALDAVRLALAGVGSGEIGALARDSLAAPNASAVRALADRLLTH